MKEQKGYFRASKRQKKQPGTPVQLCFLNFSDQINFLQFFKRENVLECWTH